jgi:hypothetical protein
MKILRKPARSVSSVKMRVKFERPTFSCQPWGNVTDASVVLTQRAFLGS